MHAVATTRSTTVEGIRHAARSERQRCRP
jgi:hypothetical protein